MSYYIGLMSGTSMDGVDAALVDVTSNELILGIKQSYSDAVQQLLDKHLVNHKPFAPSDIWQLNTLIGRDFAEAVIMLLHEANVKPQQISAIGSHGQTIEHNVTAPIPYTIQLGCAHTIAEQTGITVVADFRTRDLIVGGSGAPFAPLYHQVLFTHLPLPLAVVNIGGIANVSFLSEKNVFSGYDIGPGNCLMDRWAKKHLKQPYDKNGAWAAQGEVQEVLLHDFMKDDYFKKSAPKSIGKEYFSEEWLQKHLSIHYPVEDIQATFLALTAETVCESIINQPSLPEQVLICGGGVHNTELIKKISAKLPVEVNSTKAEGVDPDFIEAMMFAWLAEKTLHKKTVNLQAITGAKKAALLGAVYFV